MVQERYHTPNCLRNGTDVSRQFEQIKGADDSPKALPVVMWYCSSPAYPESSSVAVMCVTMLPTARSSGKEYCVAATVN